MKKVEIRFINRCIHWRGHCITKLHLENNLRKFSNGIHYFKTISSGSQGNQVEAIEIIMIFGNEKVFS